MKIAASEVATHATHRETQKHTLKEELQVITAFGKSTQTQTTDLLKNAETAESVDLSDKAAELQTALKDDSNALKLTLKKADLTADSTDIDSIKKNLNQMGAQIVRQIMERLTGKSVGVSAKSEIGTALDGTGFEDSSSLSGAFAVRYNRYESYYESESTNFYAAGKVLTEDGTEISFDLSLELSRSFSFESTTAIQAGNSAYLMDPIVINFDGNAVDLQSGRFDFDLNADGVTESINSLGQGSGFLVFDKNGDNVVNDGSEMFGAISGNGFADLAEYDEDGNGWIDENDSIYEKLGVWTPNQFGGGQIKSLKAANVGAISLQSAQTQFSLKDADNNLQAQIRATGVYLKENGGVGSVQQVDLTAQ